MHLVGLPETAVRESKDRVRSALINSGFKWPQSRITIALAPAELPKEGGGFDLPIALGILAASKQIPGERFEDCEFLGELSLNGELRSVRGVLPAAIRSRDSNRTLVIPTVNAAEAALVKGGENTAELHCWRSQTGSAVTGRLNHVSLNHGTNHLYCPICAMSSDYPGQNVPWKSQRRVPITC